MDVKPRKSPRQARAKATVDAIVEATTQVLLEEGYDQFTTARAAERAGVSVGSLYQYFPNKAALVSAMIDAVSHPRELSLCRRPRLTEESPMKKFVFAALAIAAIIWGTGPEHCSSRHS